jgi:hypothetical protein
MLVAAAVCPCPPLLLPEAAAGAAPELDPVRTACTDALGVLAAARPELLLVVGPTDAGAGPGEDGGEGAYPAGSEGSFRGFGVPVDVRLGAGSPGGRALPASLAVGARLLGATGWSGPLEGLAVSPSAEPDACVRAGRELAARAGRVALLVLGDGSACRSLKAPGYLDDRAEGFDTAVARALAAADTAALAALDPALAAELRAAGRAPWQVLAGAAEDTGLEGRLLHDEAPYGVGYFVAAWA